MSVHVIVLAAGEGKRMLSDVPKVVHVAAGRPLLGWVLAAVEPTAPKTTVVVVGHGGDHVRPILPEEALVAVQEEQLGTGHATRIGLEAIPALDPDDVVVVLYGDLPLITTEVIERLADLEDDETARLLTAEFDDPAGYGRVIRSPDSSVERVVEHRDCNESQLEIKEINAGVYGFRAGSLVGALADVTNDNSQGEYYLTDVVGILGEKGDKLSAVVATPEEVMGINSQDQLSEARKALQLRTNKRLQESGVWMLDPERTYIDDTVSIEAGARIYPGVHLEGSTKVGANAQVGPDVFAVDSAIGARSTVWYSVLRSAVVAEDCEVGPFASLRPGTVMKEGSKIGTFVETKNTSLAEGAKVPHLSYIGDATVGARANIGAGTITCNYDGIEKHPTEIGEDAFIGSDTMLVAPVRIGRGSITGAGSVITKDVPDRALAVERSEQREIPGYADRRKAPKAANESED